MKGRRQLRRSGKCEWVLYTDRHRWMIDWLPFGLKYRFYMRGPFKRTIRCEQFGVYNSGPENCFDGYNNIRVCGQHLKDVDVSNKIDEMVKSGELDRMLREAENNEGETHGK